MKITFKETSVLKNILHRHEHSKIAYVEFDSGDEDVDTYNEIHNEITAEHDYTSGDGWIRHNESGIVFHRPQVN
ncbi:hypothetical protein [Photobacterium kishitanii]|uniref:Uncharacterized protein n=1 Tax=Photobacterium kishitanii TaxID=318456 RepID=A0A2T3KLH7_9GAMM|nr:hypothetical protein [Photobacterium kishitanii]PSV00568.1 hypothetical protein C9J27_05380 [Photobacterium kishitanii]